MAVQTGINPGQSDGLCLGQAGDHQVPPGLIIHKRVCR